MPKTLEKSILEKLGNPSEVDKELRSFRKSAMVLSSKHPRLIIRYPKQWVAVYEGKTIAVGRTLNSALREVDKKGIQREHVIVRYIDKNQRTMIL